MVIRIRLIRDPGIISAAICWWTWGRWSHVEIDNGTGWLGARINGGVQVRSYNYCTPVAEEIRTLSVTADQNQMFFQFARGEIGKPYDWLAIVGIILRLPLARSPYRWFCSEYVQACCVAAGVPALDSRSTYRVTPRDIGLSPILQPLKGAHHV